MHSFWQKRKNNGILINYKQEIKLIFKDIYETQNYILPKSIEVKQQQFSCKCYTKERVLYNHIFINPMIKAYDLF